MTGPLADQLAYPEAASPATDGLAAQPTRPEPGQGPVTEALAVMLARPDLGLKPGPRSHSDQRLDGTRSERRKERHMIPRRHQSRMQLGEEVGGGHIGARRSAGAM